MKYIYRIFFKPNYNYVDIVGLLLCLYLARFSPWLLLLIFPLVLLSGITEIKLRKYNEH